MKKRSLPIVLTVVLVLSVLTPLAVFNVAAADVYASAAYFFTCPNCEPELPSVAPTYTITVHVGGKNYSGIATGGWAAVISQNVIDAVNADPDAAVVLSRHDSVESGRSIVVTAKNPGPEGNDLVKMWVVHDDAASSPITFDRRFALDPSNSTEKNVYEIRCPADQPNYPISVRVGNRLYQDIPINGWAGVIAPKIIETVNADPDSPVVLSAREGEGRDIVVTLKDEYDNEAYLELTIYHNNVGEENHITYYLIPDDDNPVVLAPAAAPVETPVQETVTAETKAPIEEAAPQIVVDEPSSKPAPAPSTAFTTVPKTGDSVSIAAALFIISLVLVSVIYRKRHIINSINLH